MGGKNFIRSCSDVLLVTCVVTAVFAVDVTAQLGEVTLQSIPQNSVSNWTITGTGGLTPTLTPSTFNLTGPTSINITDRDDDNNMPEEMVWISSNLRTLPNTLNAQLGSLGNTVANITLTDPAILLSGGTIDADDDSGSFTFTPDNATFSASSASGIAFGNNFNAQNIVGPIPDDNIPEVTGNIAQKGSQYQLLAQAPFAVPLSALASAAGVGGNLANLLGDSNVEMNLNVQASGTMQQPSATAPAPSPSQE